MIYFTILLLLITQILCQNAGLMDLHLLNKEEYPEAQCIDGSQAGFYFQKGYDEGKDKYIIFFQGGGACFGPTTQLAIASCYQRSYTKLGSSKHWPQQEAPKGVLQDSEGYNPQFHNWNKVFIPYCTGLIHQGYRKDPIKYLRKNLFFKGVNVTYSIFDVLQKEYGLSSPTVKEVLLTGTSAGGLGTFIYADYVKGLLSQNTKFWAAPDSGFFINYHDDDPNNFMVSNLRASMEMIDKNEILPKNCPYLNDPDNVYKCILPEGYAHNIKSDLYIIESEYDQFTLSVFLGVECVRHNSMQDCKESKQELMQGFRKQMISKVQQLIDKKPNTNTWLVACIQHGFFNYNSVYNRHRFQVPANSGYTANVALDEWMQGNKENNIDQVSWPHNKLCSGYSGVQNQIESD